MRCWSCGGVLDGLPKGLGGLREVGICTSCTGVMNLDEIRLRLGSLEGQSFFDEERLSEQISRRMLEGFEEIHVDLERFCEILEGIYPSQTQAEEWYEMAEELRKRHVFDESEKFFLKSIDANPLDFRPYVGLGMVYFHEGKYIKARDYLGKSHCHHIPSEYEETTYRLISMSYFYEKNYKEAIRNLEWAGTQSPSVDHIIYYYRAQCYAGLGDRDNCLASLETAMMRGPIPLGLVRGENNFAVFSKEIGDFLETMVGKMSSEEFVFRMRVKESFIDTRHQADLFKEAIKDKMKAGIIKELSELYGKSSYCYPKYTLQEVAEEFNRLREEIVSLYGRSSIDKIDDMIYFLIGDHSNYPLNTHDEIHDFLPDPIYFYAKAMIHMYKFAFNFGPECFWEDYNKSYDYIAQGIAALKIKTQRQLRLWELNRECIRSRENYANRKELRAGARNRIAAWGFWVIK